MSFICPFCYEKHDEKTCIIKCNYNVNKKIVEGNVVRECSRDDVIKNDGEIWFKDLAKCKKCTSARLQWFCPYEKNSEIPYSVWDSKPSEQAQCSISLVGAKESGKSNYIGVLIHEMENRSYDWGYALTPCDDKTINQYNEVYKEKLYNEDLKIVPAATDKGKVRPLIYSLKFPKKHKTAAITMYDVAGEIFNDLSTIDANSKYLSNSNGIVLLIDPLQIPDIREKLNGQIRLPDKTSTPNEILSRIINFLRSTNKIKGKIDIPIAIVFTKMDVLANYGILPENSSLNYDSEHYEKRAFVLKDFINTNEDVRELLKVYCPSVLNLLNEFKDPALFGISALGHNPENGILVGTPKPIRIMDPLLWLLTKHKLIDTIK